jgi:Skp family chaperone for outer membrane proteins
MIRLRLIVGILIQRIFMAKKMICALSCVFVMTTTISLTADIITAITSDMNIGVVNLFDCMGTSEQGKKFKLDVENKQKNLEEKIANLQQTFESQVKDFNAKKDLLTGDARAKEEQRLMSLQSDLQNEVQKAEQELRLFMNSLTEDLATEAEKAAIALAQEKNFDLLLEKTSGRVIYCKANYEFSELVSNKMDSSWQTRLAKNTEKSENKKEVLVKADKVIETEKEVTA